MTVEKTVEDFLEPVAVCTGKETISEVLGTLNHGRPVAVFDKDWLFLMPEAVVGYPPSRRIIDLPLSHAITIALNLSVEEALEGLIKQGSPYGLVLDEEKMLGIVSEKRLRAFISKKADYALRYSEERYKRLVEGSPDIIWSFSDKRGTLYVSTRVEAIVGYSPDYLYKNPWLWNESIHPDDQSLVSKAIRDFSSGKDLNVEYRIKDSSGNWRWFHDRSIGRQVRDGEVIIEGISIDITERKRAEEALQGSEMRLREMFENMGSGVSIYRAINDGEDFVFIDINPAGARIGQRGREETVGRSVQEVYPGVRALGLFDVFKRVWKTGKPERHPTGRYQDDRLTIWVENYVCKLPSGEIVAIYEDITERKKAEEELRQQKEQLQAILDNIPVMINYFNPNKKLIYANKTMERITGWTIEELQRRDLMSEFYPDEEYRRRVMDFIQLGEGVWSEFKTRMRDGRVLDTTWANIQLSDGTNIGIGQDITERKKAEMKLQKEKDKAKKYLDIAGVMLLALDTDRKVVLVNKKGCEILEYKEEEIIGKDWIHFLPGRYGEGLTASFAKLIVGDIEPVRYLENPVLTKSGEERIIAWHNTVLRDEGGKIIASLSSGEDITHRKRAEEEKERLFNQVRAGRERLRSLAQRLVEIQEFERRNLVRTLHDEVGQNLTGLSINLNILRSQMPDEAATKMITRIDDSHKLVEETVERIRDVMAELRPPVLDDYGLSAALHWYGKQFSDRTGISPLMQVEELTPRLPLSTETALFRITQEALTNAAKYAQARRVTLALEAIDGEVHLTIADDGIGFDATANHQPGARWGLINMRERAQAIGGSLIVETAPGKGTKITVEVPRNH